MEWTWTGCHFQPMKTPYIYLHNTSQPITSLVSFESKKLQSFDFLTVRWKKMKLVLWIKIIFWLSESYKIVWKLSNKRRIDAWQEWDKVPCFWENLCFVSPWLMTQFDLSFRHCNVHYWQIPWNHRRVRSLVTSGILGLTHVDNRVDSIQDWDWSVKLRYVFLLCGTDNPPNLTYIYKGYRQI